MADPSFHEPSGYVASPPVKFTVTNDFLPAALALKKNVGSLRLRLCSETKHFDERLRLNGKRCTGKGRWRRRFHSFVGYGSFHREGGFNEVGGRLGLGQGRFGKLYREGALESGEQLYSL